MKNLYSKKNILFFSLLIVVAMFNTVIISANIGNKKSQLFMKDVLSFTESNDDLAGPGKWFDMTCTASGTITTYESNGNTVGKSFVLSGGLKGGSPELGVHVNTSLGRCKANYGEDLKTKLTNVSEEGAAEWKMCREEDHSPCKIVNGCEQFVKSFVN